MKMETSKQKIKSIVFGGGCFWCTEAIFTRVPGVLSTKPGYAGGHTKKPTYEYICRGDTGHAEVIKVEFDAEKVDLTHLLNIFFSIHDPTSLNKQGADIGTQYRSIILYYDRQQKNKIDEFVQEHQRDFEKPIVTEVRPLEKFYPAEKYHEDYYKKNPLQPYCLLVIRPKLKKAKEQFDIG